MTFYVCDRGHSAKLLPQAANAQFVVLEEQVGLSRHNEPRPDTWYFNFFCLQQVMDMFLKCASRVLILKGPLRHPFVEQLKSALNNFGLHAFTVH